jgi:group I intron endonuclease
MILEYPKAAGIYKLTCLTNNKVYIGKTINIKRRINDHRKSKIIPNKKYKIAHAIVKYGWDSFTVEILDVFENFIKSNPEHNQQLLDTETKFIEMFDTTNNEKGYNICKHSTDRTGHICSEESKLKMSQAQKKVIRIFDDEKREQLRQCRLGKKMSDDAKEKIRNHRLGKKHSENSKEKMSIQRKGRITTHIVSEETRKKMSAARLGRLCSEETRKKISMKNKGKKRTDEWKSNMSNLKKGVPCSEEAKAKISIANTGKKCSEETKEKIRQSKRERLEIKNDN